ncbi:electron transfer flavoprotein subunit beta/FixA family protein [Homoserinimonas sp. OAct 916]|uniref:electron transfer flavoprotein subunit beta/FixA family protein n=1 Tax=Homoserinimonas sp. OAct 916 TaxID=2211450 RepID=UPI000DBEA513|nr:electron transfer flavoprotein subunit beta/FixA family protein [Homoserinimonas sp. OAct 916]
MRIVVLVKQVPDTSDVRKLDLNTGLLDRDAGEPIVDEINERGLEAALRYKDDNKGTEVVVLSMGPENAIKSIRKALSMGADSGVHIVDDSLAGADALVTSLAISKALERTGYDLVVAGNESTDGNGGIVPAMISERLGIPLLGFLVNMEITEAQVSGERQGDDGTANVHAGLPAIVTVTERFDYARFPNFKGIMTAKRKPVDTVTLAELGVDAAEVSSLDRTEVISAVERPARTAGTKIDDDGTAAATLVEYLATNRLV